MDGQGRLRSMHGHRTLVFSKLCPSASSILEQTYSITRKSFLIYHFQKPIRKLKNIMLPLTNEQFQFNDQGLNFMKRLSFGYLAHPIFSFNF